MRRYIYSGATSGLEEIVTDVMIVGSGIAGLYSALHIDPDKQVLIMSKVDFEKSNSWLAQGGIVCEVKEKDYGGEKDV